MLTEVTERGSLQLGVLEHGGRGERDEYLASVRRGHDPRGAVHAEAVVPLLRHGRLGCVDAHSHAKAASRRPFLRSERVLAVDRGGGRLLGAREREEERVALIVDFLASVLADGRAQDLPVVGEHVSVPLAQMLQQLRRALDVREHEGDGSGRQFCQSHVGQGVTPRRSILDAIGNTPLVRLRHCAPPNGAELWLKLEYRNPTGSMKDRMALAMIEGAERDGLLSPGDTVVEYTGGSTGPALALVCRAKGYRALIVMADCFTEERFQLMRALGAEIDVVPSVEGRPKVTAKDIENMVARAAELARAPGHYATDQFNNPYIIPDHRDRLGREIWEQTEGRVTAFCHGMGTASSVMGVSDALKPHGVFIQAHEPASSAAISGGERGSFLIQGWTGLVMPHWDPEGSTTSRRSVTTRRSR